MASKVKLDHLGTDKCRKNGWNAKFLWLTLILHDALQQYDAFAYGNINNIIAIQIMSTANKYIYDRLKRI